MKFLLLNQTFHPDLMATAQYLSDLAVALAQRGHQVNVIASRRAYDNPSQIFPTTENWRGVHIHRIPTTACGKTAKWRRAVDFASFILACCGRLLFVPQPDVVVALTSPPLISFIGALYARLCGAKFVYWVMDLNPDEAIAAGWLREGSLAARFLHRLSRYSFGRAQCIIALDRFMRDRIEAKGIPASKIVVLPPWSQDDAVRFDPVGRQRFRAAQGMEDRFVIMYSGNHSPCHPLATLLAAARELAADPKFLFLFVGGGSEFRKIQQAQAAAVTALPNVRLLPYQPLNELRASLSAADLHVVVMGEPFVGIIHPCKIYNILGVTAPVLGVTPGASHLTEILAALNSGVCRTVAHGDVAGCVRAIRELGDCARRGEPDRYAAISARFAQGRLLPALVRELELLSPSR